MTAHEQPISYLDSILNEEESRCEYSHQWRNFTISRSGRFKSKNRKRDVVDGKLFDANAAPPTHNQHNRMGASAPTSASHYKQQEQDKNAYRQSPMCSKPYATQPTSASASSSRGMRDKTESYKSYYETNL